MMSTLRSKQQSVLLQPDNVYFYILNEDSKEENEEKEEEEARNRVNVEALEFDWIFHEDNAERLIAVLSSLENH